MSYVDCPHAGYRKENYFWGWFSDVSKPAEDECRLRRPPERWVPGVDLRGPGRTDVIRGPERPDVTRGKIFLSAASPCTGYVPKK